MKWPSAFNPSPDWSACNEPKYHRRRRAAWADPVGGAAQRRGRAHRRGVELVVFPELALTTFFPRHYHADIAEADRWFETAMPSNETAPLFAAARKYGIGFHLGYAEMTEDKHRFNTSILVSPD